MMIDPKWMEALKLPLQVIISIAITSTCLLILDAAEIIRLNDLYFQSVEIVKVACIISVVFALVGAFDAVVMPSVRENKRRKILSTRRAVRQKEQNEQLLEFRNSVLGSGLIDQIQKMTIAAMTMADMKA
jgi:hypothetical protein